MKKNAPPSWAPNAIPTVYGWASPDTGELLVAIRGLNNPVTGYKRNQPYIQPEPFVQEPSVQEPSVQEPFVQEPTAEVSEGQILTATIETAAIIEQVESTPKKKRPGRPKRK